jgi:hypothetical protein
LALLLADEHLRAVAAAAGVKDYLSSLHSRSLRFPPMAPQALVATSTVHRPDPACTAGAATVVVLREQAPRLLSLTLADTVAVVGAATRAYDGLYCPVDRKMIIDLVPHCPVAADAGLGSRALRLIGALRTLGAKPAYLSAAAGARARPDVDACLPVAYVPGASLTAGMATAAGPDADVAAAAAAASAAVAATLPVLLPPVDFPRSLDVCATAVAVAIVKAGQLSHTALLRAATHQRQVRSHAPTVAAAPVYEFGAALEPGVLRAGDSGPRWRPLRVCVDTGSRSGASGSGASSSGASSGCRTQTAPEGQSLVPPRRRRTVPVSVQGDEKEEEQQQQQEEEVEAGDGAVGRKPVAPGVSKPISATEPGADAELGAVELDPRRADAVITALRLAWARDCERRLAVMADEFDAVTGAIAAVTAAAGGAGVSPQHRAYALAHGQGYGGHAHADSPGSSMAGGGRGPRDSGFAGPVPALSALEAAQAQVDEFASAYGGVDAAAAAGGSPPAGSAAAALAGAGGAAAPGADAPPVTAMGARSGWLRAGVSQLTGAIAPLAAYVPASVAQSSLWRLTADTIGARAGIKLGGGGGSGGSGGGPRAQGAYSGVAGGGGGSDDDDGDGDDAPATANFPSHVHGRGHGHADSDAAAMAAAAAEQRRRELLLGPDLPQPRYSWEDAGRARASSAATYTSTYAGSNSNVGNAADVAASAMNSVPGGMDANVGPSAGAGPVAETADAVADGAQYAAEQYAGQQYGGAPDGSAYVGGTFTAPDGGYQAPDGTYFASDGAYMMPGGVYAGQDGTYPGPEGPYPQGGYGGVPDNAVGYGGPDGTYPANQVPCIADGSYQGPQGPYTQGPQSNFGHSGEPSHPGPGYGPPSDYPAAYGEPGSGDPGYGEVGFGGPFNGAPDAGAAAYPPQGLEQTGYEHGGQLVYHNDGGRPFNNEGGHYAPDGGAYAAEGVPYPEGGPYPYSGDPYSYPAANHEAGADTGAAAPGQSAAPAAAGHQEMSFADSAGVAGPFAAATIGGGGGGGGGGYAAAHGRFRGDAAAAAEAGAAQQEEAEEHEAAMHGYEGGGAPYQSHTLGPDSHPPHQHHNYQHEYEHGYPQQQYQHQQGSYAHAPHEYYHQQQHQQEYQPQAPEQWQMQAYAQGDNHGEFTGENLGSGQGYADAGSYGHSHAEYQQQQQQPLLQQEHGHHWTHENTKPAFSHPPSGAGGASAHSGSDGLEDSNPGIYPVPLPLPLPLRRSEPQLQPPPQSQSVHSLSLDPGAAAHAPPHSQGQWAPAALPATTSHPQWAVSDPIFDMDDGQ